MTGATNGAGTAYPSEAPELTPGFLWGSCYSIFSFIIIVPRYQLLFSALHRTIVGTEGTIKVILSEY